MHVAHTQAGTAKRHESADWFGGTGAREAICEQLERILLSSTFKYSQRCSDFLKFLVRRSFEEGEGEPLKERSVGIEVFKRAPDYDTASDHIVRSVAGEVRKRLAQYYMEPGHAAELRISVPSGTYVAQFSWASFKPGDIAASVPEEIKPLQAEVRGFHRQRVAIVVGSALTAVLVALGLAFQFSTTSSGVSLDRFWGPLFSSGPILFCVGTSDVSHAETPQAVNNDADQPITLRDFHSRESQKVFLNDAITLARIAGLMQGRQRPFRIKSHSTVTLADLQTGPVVLIGLRSNYWTRSLFDELPFIVEHGPAPHTLMIRDKKSRLPRDWSIDTSSPYTKTTKDYALVVRMWNPRTSQLIVTAAGLTSFGTLAAGMFLTDPVQMGKLERYAPRGWEHKNLAIVLSTDVMKGSAGSPNIEAAEFW
jgi:hypothetical protein